MLFAVGGLDVSVFEHLYRALAPLVKILLAQCIALGKLLRRELALFFEPRQLVYSLKL